jgi:hypothetical protein
MADGDWSNIPREVIALDTYGTEFVAPAGWTLDSFVVPLSDLAIEIIPVNSYPYVTQAYSMTPFAGTEQLNPGVYIGGNANTDIIPLEFQPLPIPESSQSSASIEIIFLDGDNTPVEYWG